MANLAELTNNFFPVANEGFINNLSAGISSGATTVPLNSTAGYDDGDVVVLVVDPKTPEEAVFTGVVVGDAIEQVKWTEGNTGVAHSLGAPVVDYVTATHLSMIVKGILQGHNPNGTHKPIVTSSVRTDEITTEAGTIDITGDISLSGKIRSTPRSEVVASTGTLTPNIDNANIYDVTALATNLTIANPIGSPRNGDAIIIRLKDNGTVRTIGYGTAYQNISGLDTLTTTVANKWHTIGIMYSSAGTGKWQISSFTTEA